MSKWVTGQSGNRKGRTPNKHFFSETVRQLLEGTVIKVTLVVDAGDGKGPMEKVIDVKSDQPFGYGLAAAMIIRGMKGDAAAIRELINRAEGRVPEMEREPTETEKKGQVIRYGDNEIQF